MKGAGHAKDTKPGHRGEQNGTSAGTPAGARTPAKTPTGPPTETSAQDEKTKLRKRQQLKPNLFSAEGEVPKGQERTEKGWKRNNAKRNDMT